MPCEIPIINHIKPPYNAASVRYLVGGFNNLEKSESQWVPDDIPYMTWTIKFMKPPTSNSVTILNKQTRWAPSVQTLPQIEHRTCFRAPRFLGRVGPRTKASGLERRSPSSICMVQCGAPGHIM